MAVRGRGGEEKGEAIDTEIEQVWLVRHLLIYMIVRYPLVLGECGPQSALR